ncbi:MULTISPECIES: hypothetical protein [unclassified Legionella]|uniref:hypothetical protein n=1 Tax=unclassified Legionella TaxID=2622702 RepID=UPI001E48CD14|nr:hypothetical protein [Legionella sp. 31fI33]MCC5014860.1 hypothetical protein [Legionella sp. 31fI33]
MDINWGFFNSNFFNVIIAILGWWIVSWMRDQQAVKERQRETNVSDLLPKNRSTVN